MDLSPTELVRRYGAKKVGERYELAAAYAPWVRWVEVRAELLPGRRYRVEGVAVEGLEPPWEAYVALVDGGGQVGVGYVVTRRRRMFSCIHTHYQAPPGLQPPPHLVVRPVELWLTDKEGMVECIPTRVEAARLAVFIKAPPAEGQRIVVRLDRITISVHNA